MIAPERETNTTPTVADWTPKPFPTVADWTPERFREWLESHDAEGIIGYGQTPDMCPLATWLRRDLGYHMVEVDPTATFARHLYQPLVENWVCTPGWMRAYMDVIDWFMGPITASHALAALDRSTRKPTR